METLGNKAENAVGSAHDPSLHTTPARTKRASRRISFFLLISLINVGFLVLLASQLLTPAQTKQEGSVSSPLIGHLAPDFTLSRLDTASASTLHLAQLKGAPLVINFWASWCDPCKEEAPLLQQTWQQVQPQGVQFVGVDYEDTQSNALAFLHHYGITYPNVTDTTGSVAIAYGVTGVPETYFVNRQGVIVQKIIGALDQHTFQQAISALLLSTKGA